MDTKDEPDTMPRSLGRGRREGTPFYLQTTVLIGVAVFVAVIAAITLVAYYAA
jgi:hypothetical protein